MKALISAQHEKSNQTLSGRFLVPVVLPAKVPMPLSSAKKDSDAKAERFVPVLTLILLVIAAMLFTVSGLLPVITATMVLFLPAVLPFLLVIFVLLGTKEVEEVQSRLVERKKSQASK